MSLCLHLLLWVIETHERFELGDGIIQVAVQKHYSRWIGEREMELVVVAGVSS